MLRFGGCLTQRAQEWKEATHHKITIVEAVPGGPLLLFLRRGTQRLSSSFCCSTIWAIRSLVFAIQRFGTCGSVDT